MVPLLSLRVGQGLYPEECPTLLVPKIVLTCRCSNLGMLGSEEWGSGHPPHKVLVLPGEQLGLWPPAKSISDICHHSLLTLQVSSGMSLLWGNCS